ncbi:UDP-glucose:glycoprotein glucosyltransferase family GT24 [Gracilaria domingensis]|nr:UDP-glucose:glycoprotein glucosyltransferase family GT24 [Gracilaria domingensis]
MSFSRIAENIDTEYSSVSDILENDQATKQILEESLRFAEKMRLFSEVDEEDAGGEETSAMSDDEIPKRKLAMLCVLNGIVVKDVGSDVVPLALSEQERIAKLFQDGTSAETMSVAERSFDRWVAVDPSLIVVRRIGRGLKTKERRTRVTTSDDVLPPMTGGSLQTVRESLPDIKYISSSSPMDDHTTTVWLAGMDQTLPEFLRAKHVLEELAASDVVKKLKARVAILDPASVVNHEVLGCSTASSCLDIPVIAINGKRLPASIFPEVDDVVIQLASHFDSTDRSNMVDEDSRLLHRLHTNEVAAACEESRGQGEEKVPFSTVTTAIRENAHEAVSYLDRLQEEQQRATPLSVLAVVDPLSPEAYIIASFLEELQGVYDSETLSMDVVVAPTSRALKTEQEVPNTYRKFVLQGRPTFEEETGSRSPPRASFFSLPQQSVLTVSVEPPRAWFVSSHATNYDMDNVILDALPETVTELHAEYELKNLIVEGSCVDENESPPQGLKLYLENDNGVSVDTLVMANLGYFQLKVPTPGRWYLRLAPGRSSKIFSLVRMEMYKDFTKTTYTAGADGRVLIPVESFDGAGGILLRVKRNDGMEGLSVLNSQGDTAPTESYGKGGILGRLKSSISSIYSSRAKSLSQPTPAGDKKYDTIHVFSVASGHLYERFLKIMITSVTKHASRPVKFWLLENYLSPSFKKVLPLFADRHGAEVGMVTYGWPGWLRAQTEKQRIIWAYKILFLDVLFPLDVGRIIFVDSDQVIRGDLAELMDIDLKGAPYGYVPFCDSREEVEGYRFWKTGFWKETLQGAKYRISALYVVDLNTFRETAAGDSLRSIYQGLSADPNSLSNLDQDLPNYASTVSSFGGVVPIFDLPQEWLWCESWCDDESKAKAKAIDLCNNPMTKEPKLSSAKRIISEWVDYDNAASDLTEELYRYLQSQATPNLTPENITCEASPSQAQNEKASIPIPDIQLKEDL